MPLDQAAFTNSLRQPSLRLLQTMTAVFEDATHLREEIRCSVANRANATLRPPSCLLTVRPLFARVKERPLSVRLRRCSPHGPRRRAMPTRHSNGAHWGCGFRARGRVCDGGRLFLRRDGRHSANAVSQNGAPVAPLEDRPRHAAASKGQCRRLARALGFRHSNTHRGARIHDHKVKSLALCRLS